MKNRFRFFGIVAIAALVGFSMMACDVDDILPIPTVTSVTVSPASATVNIGTTRQFTAEVIGNNSPPQQVTWSIVQAGADPGTTINAAGILTIAAAETLTSLTVRAASVLDDAMSGTATVTVRTPTPGEEEEEEEKEEEEEEEGPTVGWQGVLSSPYIVPRGATLTATENGIQVSGRGTGQHDHNNGLAFNLAGLRSLSNVAHPVIVFTGTASAAGAMQTQGLDPNANTSFAAGGTWTVTIPFSTILYADVSGGQLWGGPAPMLGTDPGQNFDYTVTGITIGGVDIRVLLAGDGTPTVTGVTVTPGIINVAAGGTRSFTAAVAGNNNPPQQVTWAIDQADRSPGTTISTGGVLTVASNETLTLLTIRATAVNTTISGTATVHIGQIARRHEFSLGNFQFINQVHTRVNGFDYEAWTDDRSVDAFVMYVYADGSFSGTWTNTYNTLFRVGRRWPTPHPTVQSVGNISLRYNAPQFTSTHGATYLTVYGWTRGPLIEWYIVDRWIDWTAAHGSPSTVGAVGTVAPVPLAPGNPYDQRIWHGTVSTDGGVYDIVTSWRVNQPSIDGNRTFLQIFSVRRGSQGQRNQDNPTSGTITVSAHFGAWALIPLQTCVRTGTTMQFSPNAQLFEVAFNVEGFGGDNPSSGSGRVTELCIVYNLNGFNRVCTNPGGCPNCWD